MTPTAFAAESLIFENDSTRPFNARTLIIDNKNKGGDLILKFGRALNEQILWDSSSGKFKLTDDVDVQGTMSGTHLRSGTGLIVQQGRVGIGTDIPESVLHISDSEARVTIEDTDSQAVIRLFNSVATPAADTELGTLQFRGYDDSGTELGYARIIGLVSDDTDGSEDGYLTLETRQAGSLSEVMRLDSSGNVGIGTTSPTEKLEVVGTASGRLLHAQDRLTSSGTLAIDGAAHLQGAATFGSTITVGGVTYTFPDSDGSASGKVLATDGSGQLSWTDGAGTNLTLSADGGSNQAITENDTIEIAGGDEITTTASATDTVTIDITDDTIDFTELEDTLDLDAATTLNFGANNFIFDLTDSGDFAVRDNGSASFFVNDSGNVGIKTETPTEALEVVGTASGRIVRAQDTLASSGSLQVEGAANIHGTLSGNTIAGFNLSDCDNASTSKLLWDATTQTFSCGTDTDTDTNTNQLTTFTLTGDSGSDQTIAHGNTFDIAGGTSISTVVGATDTLTVDITDDTVDFTELEDTLDLDAATTLNFGANNFIFDLTDSGDFAVRDNGSASFFVNDSGNVGIKTETPTEALEVVGTASGRIVRAQDTLASSGSLQVEGAANIHGTLSGNTIAGFNLSDCDDATSSKLLWDATTQTFTCGSDQGGANAPKAGQGLSLNGSNFFSLSATHSGTTIEAVTLLSGAAVHAQDLLTSSGGITAEGLIQTAGNLTINADNGDADAILTFGNDAATETLQFSDTSNEFIFSDDVEVQGTLEATGQVFFAGDTRKGIAKVYDDGTGDVYGIEQVGSAQSGLSRAEMRLFTANISDGSIGFGKYTDATTFEHWMSLTQNGNVGIGATSPDTKLEIVGTASGRSLHAQDLLTSSGKLIVEGAVTFGSTINLGGVTYTFPASDGAATGRILATDGSGNLSWTEIGTGSLKTRVKQLAIPIDTAAVTTDGTDNEMNVYVGSQTGSTVNPHQYYRAETGSGQLQDVHIRVKVAVPKDFVDFSNADDLSFTYRTHDGSAAENKLDILVEDDDGDDAFTAADGEGLANTSWTAYTDEFDGGSFDPAKGEYIHITVKAYATSSGMAYAGEILLNYTAR